MMERLELTSVFRFYFKTGGSEVYILDQSVNGQARSYFSHVMEIFLEIPGRPCSRDSFVPLVFASSLSLQT